MKVNASNNKLVLAAVLSVFSFFSIFLGSAFGQCGNYFNTTYRKVGAVPYNTYTYLADWNNDGFPDLFWSEASGSSWVVHVVLHTGNGDWDFEHPLLIPSPVEIDPYQTLTGFPNLADFDSDGDLDYVDLYAGTIRMFRNNGNASIIHANTTFSVFETVAKRFPPTDLNGDGLLDLFDVSGNVGPQGHAVGYRLGQADGTFSNRVNIFGQPGLGYSERAALLGDFTGDGKPDFLITAYDPQSVLRAMIYKNTGNGNFELVNQTSPFGGIVKDVDGDGKADIVGFKTVNSITSLEVRHSNGDGTFSLLPTVPRLHPESSADLTFVEMNGDTNPDILETPYSGGGYYSVYINDGSGGFTRRDYPETLESREFFDHDGDGKDDQFIFDFVSPLGDIGFAVRKNSCSRNAKPVRMANFNGNGLPDLTFWHAPSGVWTRADAVWMMWVPPAPTTFQWGSGALGDVPAPGDFDGDGSTDYAVFRNPEGNWYIRRSSDAGWMVFHFGMAGDIPVPADYDGGGKTDFAVFRPSTGVWYILYSETQQFTAVQWGLSSDKPVPADYDGDGKLDIAVYRPSTGVWYSIRSSDQTFAIAQWGISTDVPVPADYDSDGKADLAVFRDGTWYRYIWRSLDNTFAYLYFGSAGDIPMPIVSSEFVTYITLYRPLSRTWYLRWGGNYNYALVLPSAEGPPVYFGMPNN